MLIGVAHVASIENERMIEHGSVAIRRLGHLVDQVRQHFDVILVNFRELGDAAGIFAVMGSAVETGRGGFAFRVSAAGEIAGEQQGSHAGDVGLEGQASRSNWSLMCSSKVCGTPTGTLISGGATDDAFMAICSRRSISRTLSV